MKSIKTSLLFASVLLTAGAAFAATDGPNPKFTQQIDQSVYDIRTVRKADQNEPPQSVILIATGEYWTKDILIVDAKILPPVLVTEERGPAVTNPPQFGVRYDRVEKQNAFQYKYVPKSAKKAAE